MAIDLVHTAEVIDAVIAVLKGDDGDTHTGGLPATWFTAGDNGTEEPLKTLDHGDMADYAQIEDLETICPAILVRGLGPQPTGRGGSGGVIETEEIIRVVHVRRHDQCMDDNGDPLHNMCRARERYAKIIGKALFNDPHGKLATIDSGGTRTEVSLTSSDTNGSQLIDCNWVGWDFGMGQAGTEDVSALRQLAVPMWAIACDLRVRVRSGG